MITIDLDEVEARCKPTGSEYAVYWQHRHKASQRALEMALRENRVHAECLEMATEALRQYARTLISVSAKRALADIETRLAELEPGAEEQTE